MRNFLNYFVLIVFFIFLGAGYYYYSKNKTKEDTAPEISDVVHNQQAEITHNIIEKDNADCLTKKEIQQIIKDYIEDNPKVIVESVESHFQSLAATEKVKITEKINANKTLLEDQPLDPKIGDPNAKNVIIEFFDYTCSFCKMMLKIKEQLFKNEKDIFYIFKETPILSALSVIESKVALAVYSLDKEKYLPFHLALLKSKDIKTKEDLLNLAADQGIDQAKLNELINNNEFNNVIKTNIELAKKLGISGTPAYIINGKLHEGAISYAAIMHSLNKDTNSATTSQKHNNTHNNSIAVEKDGNTVSINEPPSLPNNDNNPGSTDSSNTQNDSGNSSSIDSNTKTTSHTEGHIPAPPMPPTPKVLPPQNNHHERPIQPDSATSSLENSKVIGNFPSPHLPVKQVGKK